MEQALGELWKVFASGGMAGLLLLYAIIQTWLSNAAQKDMRKALNERDDLIEKMVDRLSDVAEKQAASNLSVAIALSRIEAALKIEGTP